MLCALLLRNAQSTTTSSTTTSGSSPQTSALSAVARSVLQQLGKSDKRGSSSALEAVPEGDVLQAADPVSRNAGWEEEVLKRERKRRSRRLERCAASDAIKRCREQNVAAMEAALREAGRIEQELRRQKAGLESSSSSSGSSGGAAGQVPALAGIRCSSDRYRRSTARAKLRSLRKLEASVPPDGRLLTVLIVGVVLMLLLISVMALDACGVLAVPGTGRIRPRGPQPARGPSKGPRGSGHRCEDALVKLGGLVVVLLTGAAVVAQQHLLVAAAARSPLGAACRSAEAAREGRQLWWAGRLPLAKIVVVVAVAAAVAAAALAAAAAAEAAPGLATAAATAAGLVALVAGRAAAAPAAAGATGAAAAEIGSAAAAGAGGQGRSGWVTGQHLAAPLRPQGS